MLLNALATSGLLPFGRELRWCSAWAVKNMVQAARRGIFCREARLVVSGELKQWRTASKLCRELLTSSSARSTPRGTMLSEPSRAAELVVPARRQVISPDGPQSGVPASGDDGLDLGVHGEARVAV